MPLVTFDDRRIGGGRLLWENPSPTTNFTAGNIILSSGDYDYLIVVTRTSTTATNHTVQILFKGLSGYIGYQASGNGNNYNIIIATRTVSFTNDTTLAVTDSNYAWNSSASNISHSVANNTAIPYRIYGMYL